MENTISRQVNNTSNFQNESNLNYRVLNTLENLFIQGKEKVNSYISLETIQIREIRLRVFQSNYKKSNIIIEKQNQQDLSAEENFIQEIKTEKDIEANFNTVSNKENLSCHRKLHKVTNIE